MLTAWQTVLLCGACCIVASCSARDEAPPRDPKVDANLEKLYAQHERYIQEQLENGFSIISADPDNYHELVKHVSSNREFFRNRVLENFFVAEQILGLSDLAKEHSVRLRADREVRKEVWLELLSESPPDSANPR